MKKKKTCIFCEKTILLYYGFPLWEASFLTAKFFNDTEIFKEFFNRKFGIYKDSYIFANPKNLY